MIGIQKRPAYNKFTFEKNNIIDKLSYTSQQKCIIQSIAHAQKCTQQEPSCVNFINILHAPFMFESLFSSFSLLRVWLWANFRTKNLHVKCWWNWPHVSYFWCSISLSSNSAFLNPNYSSTCFLKKKISTTCNWQLSSFADLSPG